MLYPKFVTFTTLNVFFIAFMLSYYNIDLIPNLPPEVVEFFAKDHVDQPIIEAPPPSKKGQKSSADSSKSGKKSSKTSKSEGNFVPEENAEKFRVFTSKELTQYNGEKGSKGLLLALLGRVFDVSKGAKHYGPNGGYHFFAGL